MYSLIWPYVYGAPVSQALFKSTPEDFHVNEFFNESFSGEGEHILLKIEKKALLLRSWLNPWLVLSINLQN